MEQDYIIYPWNKTTSAPQRVKDKSHTAKEVLITATRFVYTRQSLSLNQERQPL